MLPVSDLIELAQRGSHGADLGAKHPARFGASEDRVAVVVWNVCMHCNMTCPHCYAAAVSEPSPGDLSRAEALKLLDEMAACGVKILVFSGGEPLMRADLFDLLERSRELGLSAQLSTNGVRIDEKTASRLAGAGVAYVGISIDGLRPFNDAYRGLAGGYDAALRGLSAARAAGMKTGIRTTLTRRNADQLGAMVELASRVGADRFYVSHLMYSGRGARVAQDDLDRGSARCALEELFERAAGLVASGHGLRLVTGSNDSDGPFLLRWIERRYGEAAARPVRRLLLERGGNSAGERILNVDSSGRVHPDQFWRSAVLADVRKDGFAAALRHPLRAQLRRRLDHLTGRCKSCEYRELCRGSHRERALAVHRELWAPDPSCVMEDAEIGVAVEPVAGVGR